MQPTKTSQTPTTFDLFLSSIIAEEGGLSMDRDDPGNWTGGACGVGLCRGTKFGISARAFPHVDIQNLALETASAIYRQQYWMPIAGDCLPISVALIVGDCAVNQGVKTACMILQEAVGAEVDGFVGPATVKCAASWAANQQALVIDIAARRAVRYAQGDMTRYGLGWMRRLVRVSIEALAATQ